MQPADANREGFDLAIVTLESNQIEPIASVGPRDEKIMQVDVGD